MGHLVSFFLSFWVRYIQRANLRWYTYLGRSRSWRGWGCLSILWWREKQEVLYWIRFRWWRAYFHIRFRSGYFQRTQNQICRKGSLYTLSNARRLIPNNSSSSRHSLSSMANNFSSGARSAARFHSASLSFCSRWYPILKKYISDSSAKEHGSKYAKFHSKKAFLSIKFETTVNRLLKNYFLSKLRWFFLWFCGFFCLASYPFPLAKPFSSISCSWASHLFCLEAFALKTSYWLIRAILGPIISSRSSAFRKHLT